MEKHTFSDDDRLYLQMMQDNITRMAINSTNCKSWMVMLMSGFLALGCSINDLNGWIWIAIIPVIIFWYLDSYYLEMEPPTVWRNYNDYYCVDCYYQL